MITGNMTLSKCSGFTTQYSNHSLPAQTSRSCCSCLRDIHYVPSGLIRAPSPPLPSEGLRIVTELHYHCTPRLVAHFRFIPATCTFASLDSSSTGESAHTFLLRHSIFQNCLTEIESSQRRDFRDIVSLQSAAVLTFVQIACEIPLATTQPLRDTFYTSPNTIL
jgi:hypothetical protein